MSMSHKELVVQVERLYRLVMAIPPGRDIKWEMAVDDVIEHLAARRDLVVPPKPRGHVVLDLDVGGRLEFRRINGTVAIESKGLRLPGPENADYNLRIEAMEALLLALFRHGVDLDSDAVVQAVEETVQVYDSYNITPEASHEGTTHPHDQADGHAPRSE